LASRQFTHRPDAVSDDIWQLSLVVDPAAVSDILHRRGLMGRDMAPGILPIADGVAVRGLARTMSSRPIQAPPEPGREYALLFEAIDGLAVGEVLVTDAMGCCVWGELCSERAAKRLANGAVIDGYYRDSRMIKETGFPVFGRGRHMSDLLYHREIMTINSPVVCAGVYVEPGDLLLGGDDGVVVVPRALIAEVVVEAGEKGRIEGLVREELRVGASAAEVYGKYKVM
jgi:4-hydroxy-4-methyl-2-oxoglutarate aldolase